MITQVSVLCVAVMAIYGSHGTSWKLWQLPHLMTVTAHYGTLWHVMTVTTHYGTFPPLYWDCYAQHTCCPSLEPSDSRPDREWGTRTNRDSTVTWLRKGLLENWVRFPTTAKISLLSTEFRTSLEFTNVSTDSCEREAAHTFPCSVETKNAWGYNFSSESDFWK